MFIFTISGIERYDPECRRFDDGSAVAASFCVTGAKLNAVTKTCERSPCPARFVDNLTAKKH